ncbi:hypothetical protein [Lacinutrix salivirga]
MKTIRLIAICTFMLNLSYGQVKVQRNFNLELAEKDSIKSSVLEKSLNGFLTEALNNSFSQKYVDRLHLKQYNFFFRKLAGIGHDNESIKFNDPSILKSFTPNGEDYKITVAFTGIQDGTPFVFQITELKAIPYKGYYRFYCPFEENTANFKSKTFKNVTYHFSSSINEENAEDFADFKDKLSALTKTQTTQLDYYCFESLDELLKSYGFLYSARQCNFLCYDLGFTDNGGNIYMTGTGNENYVFGYIGDYLYYNLPNQENIYWPFVQGLSTYYGGYGLSYEGIDELKQQFKDELRKNPNINFLEEFKKGRKSSINRHFTYYVISAFLTNEVLDKKSFDELLLLVYSGKDGERFFENLDNAIGINEHNFHENILSLINNR